MKKRAIATLLPLTVLTACGAPTDDLATIPVRGKWVERAAVRSISINGVAIDPRNMPLAAETVAKINQSREICGEPENLDEQEFQEKMGNDKFGNCTIDSTQSNGNRIYETASCDALNLPGVTERVRITGNTVLYTNKVVSDISLSITGQNPDTGARGIIQLEMQGTSTRIGDC